ncbi:methylenetetrahydrofolate reductase C-terminal domain-containing protein [Sneathiella limimaris]|uniref:methylenetetrahydrofolate reductase C-terminal domain-containing protein n=1 Tax=Sneathiella limimaris TaxID=1964213 RepID=UPI00146C6E70|nr:methylenetetrahydrofolate reductase C-terminal domain-containing protein [Sneathiella limimaris]
MVKVAYHPAQQNPIARTRSAFTIRLWSVRHSRFLEKIYKGLASLFLKLHPVWTALGYSRVEKPVVAVEKRVKAFLFDCRMCGQCVLSDTGMSCPMNCPKSLRNGPCGGVRSNGNCEVEPDMPCVWGEAWKGSQQMQGGDQILKVQKPIDHSLRGSSAWLRATSEAALQEEDK